MRRRPCRTVMDADIGRGRGALAIVVGEQPMPTAAPEPTGPSPAQRANATSLGSRRGVAILVLLCLVQFMLVLDTSILNIALPSIKRDLGFTQQSLQWVVDGYLLTYGGCLLLG